MEAYIQIIESAIDVCLASTGAFDYDITTVQNKIIVSAPDDVIEALSALESKELQVIRIGHTDITFAVNI